MPAHHSTKTERQANHSGTHPRQVSASSSHQWSLGQWFPTSGASNRVGVSLWLDVIQLHFTLYTIYVCMDLSLCLYGFDWYLKSKLSVCLNSLTTSSLMKKQTTFKLLTNTLRLLFEQDNCQWNGTKWQCNMVLFYLHIQFLFY